MKYLIILGISFLLLFNINEVNAQKQNIKKDTVYYLLDTASIPIKDRLFDIQREGPFLSYVLLCKCYPRNTNPVFSFHINRQEKSKPISLNELNQITTISLSKLIEIVIRYGKDRIDKNVFYFIEPNGDLINMTKVYLLNPRHSQDTPTDYEIIKPSKY